MAGLNAAASLLDAGLALGTAGQSSLATNLARNASTLTVRETGSLYRAAKETSAARLIYRYRNGKESVSRLARGAADAESHINVHGVSVTTNPIPGRPCAVACFEEVEKVFEIVKTGANPHHYTVVLPNPVTKEVADQFNYLFRDLP